MRLIDADVFIEDLGLDEENAREDNLGEIVTLEDFDRQETAYDIDMVISKMEMYIYKQSGNEMLSDNNKRLVTKVIEECIKIVKSGGV